MPAIAFDTRAVSQELGEHLNYFVTRSVDHRVLETLAVGKFRLPNMPLRLKHSVQLTNQNPVFTIVFGVGGYMYYAIKVQSK
ncbi:hypothetical protein diail_11596 [Diaporthe ilicicola]|nr:hypothetical protein diail_11596 [Diaporthe ilicicola]